MISRNICLTMVAACCLAAVGPLPAQDTTDFLALVDSMPTNSLKEADAKAAQLLDGGRTQIMEALEKLTPRGEPNSTGTRYLLDTAVLHANRDDADVKRRLLAECIGKALEVHKDKEIRTFLLELISRTDPKTARPIVARYTSNKDVGEDAVRTLLYMHDPEVTPLLMRALPGSEGPARAAILYGLGDLRAKHALTAISNIKPDTPEVRMARAYALASLAAPAARDALNAASSESDSSMEKARVAAWKLMYVERLAESDDKTKAIEIARQLFASVKPEDSHLRAASLSTLVKLQGEGALDAITFVLNDENNQVRNAAIQFAVELPGSAVTTRLGAQLDELTSASKIDLLRALGARGDKAAMDAVKRQTRDDTPAVQAQAILAVGKIGGKDALPELLRLLSSENKELVDAVRAVLLQSDAKDIGSIAAGALEQASTPGKVMLLDVMATRNATAQKETVFNNAGSPERDVRIGAIRALATLGSDEDLERLRDLLIAAQSTAERKEVEKTYAAVARRAPEGEARIAPLLAAYDEASQPNKESILSTFAQFGGTEALEIVTRETSSTQPEIQTAAVRALSEWSNSDAIPQLEQIAKSENESHHVLAMRGYLRLLDDAKMPQPEKLRRYRAALKDAHRDDEKRTALTGLGEIRTTASLQLLMQYQDNENLASDAAVAVAKVVLPAGRRNPGLHSAEAAEALLKALPHLNDKEQKKRAEKQVNEINFRIETSALPADDEGFVPLFNGKNLAGWTGSLDGYVVEDGAIVCIPEKGGNLFTERQFDNFVLRFEFKLTPRANNGLGIRAPLVGDPAFSAMELQILDNGGHPNIKPWQRHGSIYGVADAEDGHLKPNGEWNEQEVTAKDGHITIKLNGTVITDANVWDIPTTGTQDGRPHPGLHRRQGHIGFLGHGSRIEVRNIRLREIINEVPEGFTALFNGKDLSGWKGLVANPIKRKEMSPDELAAAQEKADNQMREHWQVINGNLIFDGDGSHLCTTKDYDDFEMLVDWKLGPGGDSGIYLRGSPQVQIWDVAYWPEGSGGLYNNQKNTSSPLICADHPLNEWNTFRINMEGEKVTVHLNDQLVVDNVTLENYWDRKQPIFPKEQIELQSHGSPAYFRNIFVREK